MDDAAPAMAKNRAWPLEETLDAALAAGEIDEAEWYRRVAAFVVPRYLAGGNPRAQSGHRGDEAHWERARSLVVDGVAGDGTFLDVGCASGHLMECVAAWAARRSIRLEPFGLDIAPELAELARRRLPGWADRIFVGNVIDWEPPLRFDCVRTGLEYVPARRRRDLVSRLLGHVVRPGGRLILGTMNEERARPESWLEAEVGSWGFRIAGRSERPHWKDARIVYHVFWIDARTGGPGDAGAS